MPIEPRHDCPRVFAIQGTFFGASPLPESSYPYSRMFHMWGWAGCLERAAAGTRQ